MNTQTSNAAPVEEGFKIDPVLLLRLQKLSREQKFASGMVLLIFVSTFAGFHYLFDAFTWKYQGIGIFVWFVFAFCIAFGWFNAATMTSGLNPEKNFYKVANLTKLKGFRNFTITGVQDMFRTVAKKASIKEDDFTAYLVQDDSMNAFAAGTGSGRIVALHTGLLENLERPEVEAVLAHEFGHQRNNDIFLLVFVTSAIGTFIFLGKALFNLARWDFLVSDKKDNDSNKKKSMPIQAVIVLVIVGCVCYIIGYLMAPLMAAYLSRKREYMADAYATALGYGKHLQSALRKLSEGSGKTVPANSAVAALYINQPQQNFIQALFSTHPPIPSRVGSIDRLMDKDEGKVPDILETFLKGLFKWVVLPVAGAVFLSLGQCCSYLPNWFGVPQVFIFTVAWFFMVNNLMASTPLMGAEDGFGKKTKGILIVVSMTYLLLQWFAGYYAIEQSGLLHIWPFDIVAQFMLYAWIAKPFVAMLGSALGFAGVLSDLINIVSWVYCIAVFASLFYSMFYML